MDQCVERSQVVSNDSPHVIVVEHLLMIGGVEPNLGPPEKICYGRWTRDASRFLWPSIGAVEGSLSVCVKCYLKYFDPCTKGGNMVFASINVALSKTNDELKYLLVHKYHVLVLREEKLGCLVARSF